MPDSIASPVSSPTSTTAPPSRPYSASQTHAAGLLSPDQARVYLNLTHDQLLHLVRTARLRAVRNPAGQLTFAKDDLDAIPEGVSPEVAAAELISIKEAIMINATMAVPSEIQSPTATSDQLTGFIYALDELRRTIARSPKWVDIDDAVTLYGVPLKTIKQWANQGFVRKAKLGPTFQSKSLYNTEDLNEVLCRVAAGKPPIYALRKEA